MLRVLALLLAAVACGTGLCQDWPTFCHDHARTGIATAEGPAEGTIAWTAELGGSVDGSPIVVEDRVYVGNSDGVFFALDRGTGEVVWQQSTGGAIVGAGEIGDGKVFVGSVDCFLYAFDVQTGQRVWRHRTSRPVLGAPTFLGDKVVFGSMDKILRAVAPDTGRILWEAESEGGISAPVTVHEGMLYCGDEEGGIRAVSSESGEAVWQGKLVGRIVAAPMVADGKLLVPLMSRSALTAPAIEFLTAWDLADGSKLWGPPKPLAVSVMGSPTVFEDTVWTFTVEGYVSTGRLRAIKISDGQPKAKQWEKGRAIDKGAERLVVDASLAIAGETLYVAAQNGIVYFLNAKTGGVKKKVSLGGKVFSSPAIAGGKLYVGCQDGKLYCIE